VLVLLKLVNMILGIPGAFAMNVTNLVERKRVVIVKYIKRNKLTNVQCAGHGDIATMPAEVVGRCARSAHRWIGRRSLLAVRVMMEHIEPQDRQRIVNHGCSENDYEGFGIEYPLVICATNHNLMDAVKYLIDECQANVDVLSCFECKLQV
jgi:hypothetical protein